MSNEKLVLHFCALQSAGHGCDMLLISFSRLVRDAAFSMLAIHLLTQLTHTVIGALVVMMGITIANMRRGVLLHKLILLEVCASKAGRPFVS